MLTVGRVAAGTKDNIIPDDAVIDATLRTFSVESRALAHEVVAQVSEGVPPRTDSPRRSASATATRSR